MRTEIVCDNRVDMFRTVGDLRKMGYNCFMIFCKNEPRFYLRNNIIKVGKVALVDFVENLDKYFKLKIYEPSKVQRDINVYS